MTLVVLASLALMAGGAVKGTTGLGLPLVSVPLLTYLVGLARATELMVVPIIATNFVQSFQGGNFRAIARRFWTLLVPLVLSIVASAYVLVRLPERALDLILGVSLVVLAPLLHFGTRFNVSGHRERWLSPLIGLVSGALGGFSTIFGPPVMLYMRALRLGKTEFVAALSLIYLVGSIGIFIGIYGVGPGRLGNLWLSVAACVPVFLGLWTGLRLHNRLSEHRFGQALLGVLLMIGISFIIRSA
jgi:uncharacterized membrane protein YfcA